MQQRESAYQSQGAFRVAYLFVIQFDTVADLLFSQSEARRTTGRRATVPAVRVVLNNKRKSRDRQG